VTTVIGGQVVLLVLVVILLLWGQALAAIMLSVVALKQRLTLK
jgi:hypothetical protein